VERSAVQCFYRAFSFYLETKVARQTALKLPLVKSLSAPSMADASRTEHPSPCNTPSPNLSAASKLLGSEAVMTAMRA
jgi:hypothetical protein